MKSRNFFKKGIIWTLVVSLLFGTTAMAALVSAETNVNLELTVGQEIDAAAKVFVKTATFVQCLNQMSGIGKSETDTDDLFEGSDSNPVLSGSWIVLQAEADGYDIEDSFGVFNCNGGDTGTIAILDIFRNMLGLQREQIFCNKDNTELPGLIAGWDGDSNSMMTSSGCSSNIGDDGVWTYNDMAIKNPNITSFPTVYGQAYRSGQEYIQLLYNHWAEEQNNDYLVQLGLGDGYKVKLPVPDGNMKYFILKNDFTAACKGVKAASGENGAEYIYTVSEDGALGEEFFKPNGNSNKQASWGFIVGGIDGKTIEDLSKTCGNFLGKVNSSAKTYRENFFEIYTKACNDKVGPEWQAEYHKADLISRGKEEIKVNNGQRTEEVNKTYTDEEKKAADDFIKKYNAFNASTSKYARYSESLNGEGPFECVMPDGSLVGSAGYKDDGVLTGTADSCQSNAGALGWIICNVLEMAGSAAESAYESFLKPQLEVNPVLIGATGNNSTANAWAKFQGFANIIFVIVFLVIIFSQLTGYGIDNYGIKKILPKLVVTVILVNLSFVICQVAVDLSNILGNSLQKLFSSIDIQNMTLTETFEGTTDTFQISAGTQTLLWVVLVGVLVGGGIAIWRNPALLISLLVSVLGVLIAGFFVFILLAARQAAIVVLIVLSPLAFVCYALPNTKKLFDKWLKMMQALLLVYPICGLLIGGGDFASRLLLSAGLGTSFAAGLTAMLVGIVPIFFIPTVVKNSMSALGGLGAKISGLGNKVSGGAKSTLRNTRAYKNAQERGKARGDRKFAQARAGVHLDKKTGEFVNNRSPIARLRRRAAGSRVGQFFGADAAMGEQQAKLRGMEEKRQQNAMTAEVGIAPLVNADNLRQKMQNAINEAIADNKVPVVPVDVELAVQRRKSANEAQELKNYKDQFAEYSQEQLRDEAGKAGTWLKEEGGTQKMQALLSAMESRGGMERDMIKMVKNNGHDIGDNEKIMNTLAGSKNKVLKAFGKAGKNQSYDEFMSGTGNGKSLAEYVKEKDVDFLDGLDDKALAQIRNYQTPNNEIMSGSMLAQAASKINSQDATDEIDEMIRSKIESGGKVEFSAAQYANLNNSTQEMLDSLHRSGNSSVGDNLIRISNDMINAPEQYAKLKFGQKDADGKGENGSGTYLNEARARAGLGTMQDAIQSLHVPHSS